jgi:hypothetical protein
MTQGLFILVGIIVLFFLLKIAIKTFKAFIIVALIAAVALLWWFSQHGFMFH